MITLKEINGSFEAIARYHREMYSVFGGFDAMAEDAGHDAYMSEQPGGYGVMSKRNADMAEYEERLNQLTMGSVFGALYDDGTDDDKATLKLLSDSIDRQFDYGHIGLNSKYPSTVFEVLDCLVKNGSTLADAMLTSENIKTLCLIGTYIDHSAISYDDVRDEFQYRIDINQVVVEYINIQHKKQTIECLLDLFNDLIVKTTSPKSAKYSV